MAVPRTPPYNSQKCQRGVRHMHGHMSGSAGRRDTSVANRHRHLSAGQSPHSSVLDCSLNEATLRPLTPPMRHLACTECRVRWCHGIASRSCVRPSRAWRRAERGASMVSQLPQVALDVNSTSGHAALLALRPLDHAVGAQWPSKQVDGDVELRDLQPCRIACDTARTRSSGCRIVRTRAADLLLWSGQTRKALKVLLPSCSSDEGADEADAIRARRKTFLVHEWSGCLRAERRTSVRPTKPSPVRDARRAMCVARGGFQF